MSFKQWYVNNQYRFTDMYRPQGVYNQWNDYWLHQLINDTKVVY